jgi:hypothetical protein
MAARQVSGVVSYGGMPKVFPREHSGTTIGASLLTATVASATSSQIGEAALNSPSVIPVILYGMLGGALIEVTHWYGLRTNKNFPVYARSPLYWITALIMVVLGGLLALLFLGSTGAPKDAVGLGLATPAVLQRLAAAGLTIVSDDGAGVRAKGTSPSAPKVSVAEWRDRGSITGPSWRDFLIG